MTRITQTLISAAGVPLDPSTPPETVHYAEGVDVEVFGPWDIEARARSQRGGTMLP